MNKFCRQLAIAACVALATAGPACAQAEHNAEHADHHAHGSGKLALDHGKKWQTDDTLRAGMEALRASFAAQHPAIDAETLSADQYKRLGELTEKSVAQIVAKCKLAPEGDAMLHHVIADMLAGADAMQGKSKEKPNAGARAVVHALMGYGQYFEHPGWKGLHQP
ncbi:MAG: hypothetical protein V4582_02215 [Pseudomonadota bacterium]